MIFNAIECDLSTPQSVQAFQALNQNVLHVHYLHVRQFPVALSGASPLALAKSIYQNTAMVIEKVLFFNEYLWSFHHPVSLTSHLSLTVVPMPSSQFEFKLSNTSVAQLDVKKSSVLGVKLGYTKVTLEDKSILCDLSKAEAVKFRCVNVNWWFQKISYLYYRRHLRILKGRGGASELEFQVNGGHH